MPEDDQETPEQEAPTVDPKKIRESIQAATQEQQREDAEREPSELEQEVAQRREQRQAQAQTGQESASQEYSDEELQARAEKKAKVAQLLDRGIVNDRLDPRRVLGDAYDPNRVYEWHRDNENDLARVQSLEGRVEKKPDGETPEGTHGTADSRIKIGDVVLVSFDRETYEMIQEVREEKKERRRGSDAGRREYLSKVSSHDAAPAIQPER